MAAADRRQGGGPGVMNAARSSCSRCAPRGISRVNATLGCAMLRWWAGSAGMAPELRANRERARRCAPSAAKRRRDRADRDREGGGKGKAPGPRPRRRVQWPDMTTKRRVRRSERGADAGGDGVDERDERPRHRRRRLHRFARHGRAAAPRPRGARARQLLDRQAREPGGGRRRREARRGGTSAATSSPTPRQKAATA